MYSWRCIYLISLVCTIFCEEESSSHVLRFATWNIGLEEKQATERTSSIIQAIRQKDVDILCLQEVWGGPQILREIYQAVKDIYPNFQVLSDSMRDYISMDKLQAQVYSPACPYSKNAQQKLHRFM